MPSTATTNTQPSTKRTLFYLIKELTRYSYTYKSPPYRNERHSLKQNVNFYISTPTHSQRIARSHELFVLLKIINIINF